MVREIKSLNGEGGINREEMWGKMLMSDVGAQIASPAAENKDFSFKKQDWVEETVEGRVEGRLEETVLIKM